jgi:SAM-dependent methyltransferase
MNTTTPATATAATAATAEEATPFDDGALYDLFLGDVDIGLDFYMGLARAAGGPVLDVACGTGRVLLPCLQSGVDIEGVDLFAGMLTRLREKAAALQLQPALHQADMATFKLPRRYALIIIPFNAFVHNLTTDAQLATLHTCRQHLVPGGQLVFDTYFPGLAWIGAPSGTRVLEMEIIHPQSGTPMRLWDTRTFDRVEQLQFTYNEMEQLDAAGNVVAHYPSRTTLRWIYKAEMDLLLRLSGFERWRISGDFEGNPVRQETDAMIVQAWTKTSGDL